MLVFFMIFFTFRGIFPLNKYEKAKKEKLLFYRLFFSVRFALQFYKK